MWPAWIKRRLPLLGIISVLCIVWVIALAILLHAELNPPKWHAQIEAFANRDQTNAPPPGAVLFVGSSTIRLWDTLASDFPKYRVFRRGLTGAQLSDAIQLADHLILPYEPRMVVLYAGDNDLAAGKSPREVLRDFKRLVSIVHAELPDTRIAFISIKPSVARWDIVGKVRKTNRLLRQYSLTDDRVVYIDIFQPMLDTNNRPSRAYLAGDGLHLSERGYRLWADLVRPHLKAAPDTSPISDLAEARD